MRPPPDFKALTVKFPGLASQIISGVGVSEAFDPDSPPDPLPPQIQTMALWDTGASKSVISQALAKDLGLTPTGAINITHAGGTSISPTHIIHFHLPNKVRIQGVIVTEFPGVPNFGAIIGMDVIGVGDMAITNVGGQTWMSFRCPSTTAIDYVAVLRPRVFLDT